MGAEPSNRRHFPWFSFFLYWLQQELLENFEIEEHRERVVRRSCKGQLICRDRMGNGCTRVGILHHIMYVMYIIYRCIDAYGSYQMSLALTKCLWVLPDVLGSYQMSGALPRVSWFHTGAAGRCRWWEGGVRSKLPAFGPWKGGYLTKKSLQCDNYSWN